MTPYNDTIDPSFEECMSSEGQSGSPIWCACCSSCCCWPAPAVLTELTTCMCRLDDPSTGEPLVIGAHLRSALCAMELLMPTALHCTGILTFGPGGPGSNETDYSDYDYTGTCAL